MGLNNSAVLDPGAYMVNGIDYAASVYQAPMPQIAFTDQYGRTITIDEQLRNSIEEIEALKSSIQTLFSDFSFLESQLMLERQKTDALVKKLKQYNTIPGGGDGSLR